MFCIISCIQFLILIRPKVPTLFNTTNIWFILFKINTISIEFMNIKTITGRPGSIQKSVSVDYFGSFGLLIITIYMLQLGSDKTGNNFLGPFPTSPKKSYSRFNSPLHFIFLLPVSYKGKFIISNELNIFPQTGQ